MGAVSPMERLGRGFASGAGVVLALALGAADFARAGEADVLEARAACSAQRVCRFAVTLRHADSGWEHYANRWEVVGPDGEVLATRVLRHPHVEEQPFTRELPGVRLPESLSRVRIRAHDSVHAYGGAELWVELPSGDPPAAPRALSPK
jgi:hypothetical protein